LASGEYLGAFAVTEPGAGSDVANMTPGAVEDGDHYIMNSSKVFSTNGGAADTFITFARTSKENGSKGISSSSIEKDTRGVVVDKPEHKMRLNGSRTVQLNFDECKIPKAQMLVEE